MKLNLSPNEQAVLYGAFEQLDGYASAAGVAVIRVPFKLGGSARRIIVKNMVELRAKRAVFDETQKALFKETWPDKQPWARVERLEDPEIFDKHATEHDALSNTKEELEFLTLPSAVVYSDANEFPAVAVAILEGHGLIVD